MVGSDPTWGLMSLIKQTQEITEMDLETPMDIFLDRSPRVRWVCGSVVGVVWMRWGWVFSGAKLSLSLSLSLSVHVVCVPVCDYGLSLYTPPRSTPLLTHTFLTPPQTCLIYHQGRGEQGAGGVDGPERGGGAGPALVQGAGRWGRRHLLLG